MKSVQKRKPSKSHVSRETDILLKTMTLRRWAKGVEGCLGFLIRLEGAEKGEHEPWFKGNRNYYLTRLTTLLDNVPKGAEKLAMEVRAKLASL